MFREVMESNRFVISFPELNMRTVTQYSVRFASMVSMFNLVSRRDSVHTRDTRVRPYGRRLRRSY